MKIEPDWLDIEGIDNPKVARIIAEELAVAFSNDPEFQAELKRIQEQALDELLNTS